MQDILVHASRLEPWSSSIEYGVRLASLIKGSVTGAYVYSSPLYTAPPYCSTELLTAIIENAHTMEAAAAAAERPFSAWAASLGAKHASWQVAEGYLPEALAHIGTWHDLLVLERNPDSAWGSPPDVASLILAACLPTIVVPSEYTGGVDLDCVALAWNGAPEALRAIHAAMPLLQRAGRVVLLTGERRDTYQDITWAPPFDMGVHLERHGIKVHRQQLVTEDDVAGETLLEAVKKLGAGLLVMGAYGRSRFSEWALGGATRQVLGHATLPVFMRH
jgi:nucleotide-binding universal stress UspA family protein